MALDKCNGCPDWTTVDRRLLPIKATYFFLYGAFGFLHPYIVVFMKQHLGLSPVETSVVLTVSTIGSAVARIIIGVIADAFRKHSVIVTICCVITAVGHVILYFTPSAHSPMTSDSLAAGIYCSDGRIFVCLQENSITNWDNSSNITGRRIVFRIDKQQETNGCSLRCCNGIQETQQPKQRTTTNQSISISSTPVANLSSSSSSSSSVDPFTSPSLSLQSTEICKTFAHLLLAPPPPLETNRTLWGQTNCSSARRFHLDHVTSSESRQSSSCEETEMFSEFDNCTFSCTGSEWLEAEGGGGGGGGLSPLATQFGNTFWMFIVVFFVIIFFSNPAFSVVDSITYSTLRGRGGEFGKVRLWGTIALGSLATVSGLIMDALGGPQSGSTDDAYLIAFVACSALLIPAAVAAYNCPSDSSPPRSSRRTDATAAAAAAAAAGDGQQQQQQQQQMSVGRSLALLVRRPSVDVIFVTVLVSGVLIGCHDAFFFWFLNSLEAGQLVLGTCVLAMSLSEVLLLFTSGRIVALLGYRVCLYVTFVVYGIRFLVNSFLVSPWLAVLTESVHSICCGLMFPAASMSINEMAPTDGMHGTIQGILGALHWSVGRAIGLAVAGVMYEAFGPRLMYRITSGTAFLCALLLAVTMETMRLAQHCRRQKKEPDGVSLEIKVSLSGVANERRSVKEDDKKTDDETTTPMLP